jgi:hypothetical protein
VQLGVDQMRKTPLWISATSGASPKGYALQREDGKPAFSVHDHDFPIEQRMLMSCSGVHLLQCHQHLPCEGLLGGEKPQLKTATAGQMNVFIRPHRYQPVSAETNISDLNRVMAMDAGAKGAEVVLVTGDNGPDYAVDSSLVQHCLGRVWKQNKHVMLMVTAHAPGHSSWHSEIEPEWSVARRCTTGQHFGRTAVESDDPFAGHEREEACRLISAAGVKEFAGLLAKGAATAGKLWNVYVPKHDEPSAFLDMQAIKNFYAAGAKQAKGNAFEALREEAAIFGKRVTKLPSVLVFRMCVGDEKIKGCRHCSQILAEKRSTSPLWHPRQVLAPLRFNNYQPLFPALPEEAAEAFALDGAVLSASKLLVDRGDAVVDNKRNPYLSFLAVLALEKPQVHVRVPVSSTSKRLEDVLPCSHPGCRYWAKTPAEHSRHISHFHAASWIAIWQQCWC